MIVTAEEKIVSIDNYTRVGKTDGKTYSGINILIADPSDYNGFVTFNVDPKSINKLGLSDQVKRTEMFVGKKCFIEFDVKFYQGRGRLVCTDIELSAPAKT